MAGTSEISRDISSSTSFVRFEEAACGSSSEMNKRPSSSVGIKPVGLAENMPKVPT